MASDTQSCPLELTDEVSLCAAACGMERDRVAELATFARERGQALVDVLVERGGADERRLVEGLASRLGLPCVLSEPEEIPDDVLADLSPRIAFAHHVIPLERSADGLHVACRDPFDLHGWDELVYLADLPLVKVLCPKSVIDRMIKSRYGLGADTVERLVSGREKDDAAAATAEITNLSEAEAANEPTVVNLVNQVLSEAIRANATDVHFEPFESRYRVRYRVDGMLEDVSMPVSVHLLKFALVARIKIMSNLDITEKRLPQDGRCTVSLGGHDYDLRVSILPGIHGEAVVIRLQSRQMARLDLASLGFRADERERIERMISRPHGLFLVTGPTGSGKTTTLYTCLEKIVSPTTKIITVEDPVEYWMDDILQMQVHEEIGFDFARALRSILRHDPDVILVGEIRDAETADIAIRASLTGHLVFATLHTNDAAGAPTRLIDIGVEPFLVASSVHGVLAQRLVRKICPHCRTEADRSALGPLAARMLDEAGVDESSPIHEGAGCERCRFTGFRGRAAIGEILPLSADVRQLVQHSSPAEEVRRKGLDEGMVPLRRSAVLALREGVTTASEVMRVTQEDL